MADYFINQAHNHHLPTMKQEEVVMPPPHPSRPTFSSDPHHYRRESASDIHEILTNTSSSGFNINSGRS